jgi:uncharacterized membrane protein (UPF0127 family)
MKRLATLMACAILAACSSPPQPEGNDALSSVETAPQAGTTDGAPQHLAKVPLLVRHGDGAADTRLSIEIALTPRQQEQGLMHRTDLKPGEGMIFPMLPARMANFWMKGTPTPLDLIFIRTDGSIERIAHGKPNDLTPLFVEIPVAGVLELRGGDAKRLGINEGDRIFWGHCITTLSARAVLQAQNFCPT